MENKDQKDTRMYLRVTQSDKKNIVRLAEICGLSQSEYLRQRALGFAPRAVLPDVFFHFCEKLDRLCEPPFSAEVNDKAVALLAEMEAELVRPQKEHLNEGDTTWRQQDSGPLETG